MVKELGKKVLNNKYTIISKLSGYYYAQDIFGLAITSIIAITMYFFPEYYSWVAHMELIEISIVSITIVNFILLLIEQFVKLNFFLLIRRYIYVSFFILFIYTSGKFESPFIYILFFPLLSSATYLNRNAIRNVGIVSTIALILMIFTYPSELKTIPLLMKYILEIILFAAVVYLMHRLVVEILIQKFEKDRADERISEIIELDKLKEDFLSMAQHQLRTPITGVKWVLETLKSDSTLPKNTMDIIDSGLGGIKDSISIINKMLQTAEGKSNDIVLSKNDTNLVEVINEILKELRFVIQKKEVKVFLDLPESLIISVDKDKLKAALNNLIDNAIKYSPNGTVVLSLKQDDKLIRFIIKDNGIGISYDDLPYIFDRLHRGKNAIMIEPDESGVGLYISKKIIKLHGGDITASSEIGKGTTITVILPKVESMSRSDGVIEKIK